MSENLLDLALKRLASRVESGDVLVRLLGLWFGLQEGEVPVASEEGQGLWQYQEVARAALREATGQLPPRPFTDGLAALRRREFFAPHKLQGFEADPLAILAVAIGIRAAGRDADSVAWLKSLVDRAAEGESDGWRRGLLSSAKTVLGSLDRAELLPVQCVALSSKGVTTASNEELKVAQEVCLATDDTTPDQAVFRLIALQHLLVKSGHLRLGALESEDVVSLLRSVEAALRRWPWEAKPRTTRKDATAQQWDIQNEYHVQSLLWALLRPVFSDLKDEEYLKSIGYKHPRVDLAIPSLRLIIEVKYLYEATQSALAEKIEELAADATLYLSEDNGFDHIIAFLWDATGSVQHHAALEAGLRKLKGVEDAVVVSRPGDWYLIADNRIQGASV